MSPALRTKDGVVGLVRPRRASRQASNVTIGDIIDGAPGRPRSKRNSAALSARRRGGREEFDPYIALPFTSNFEIYLRNPRPRACLMGSVLNFPIIPKAESTEVDLRRYMALLQHFDALATFRRTPFNPSPDDVSDMPHLRQSNHRDWVLLSRGGIAAHRLPECTDFYCGGYFRSQW